MAIKTLGSTQKIRVGRESGNTTFIFLGLNYYIFKREINILFPREIIFHLLLILITFMLERSNIEINFIKAKKV